MTRRRQEASEEELRILQLPDEEVIAQLDEFVEAWEQHEDAKRQLQKFEANTAQPSALTHIFDGTDSFIDFNRRRREFVKRYEELRRNRDDKAERLRER